jgi:hypothetical protein
MYVSTVLKVLLYYFTPLYIGGSKAVVKALARNYFNPVLKYYKVVK